MTNAILKRWAKAVASVYQANVSEEAVGIRLTCHSDSWKQFSGGTEEVIIEFEAPSTGDSRSRLRVLEKAVAQAIISAPVGFQASLHSAKRLPSDGTVVLRFAFGFSLSLGRSSRRRYTIYSIPSLHASCLVVGDDSFFSNTYQLSPLDYDSETVKLALPDLGYSLELAEREYRESALTETERGRAAERATSELRDLDSLYRTNHGRNAVLIGMGSDQGGGDDAIASEYLGRLEDIVGQFKMTVLLEPLSLGVIRCNARITRKGSTTEVKLPFRSDVLVFESNVSTKEPPDGDRRGTVKSRQSAS